MTSTKMAQLALKMDIDGETNVLQEENAYFDGTFNRVHRFISFTLWMFHPTLRKVLRLANMELHTENTKDITIFFTLFNEVLAKFSGKERYKFNPRAFICDEGGANFIGLKEVYGTDFMKNRVFGCQWHSCQTRRRKLRTSLTRR